MKITFSRVKAVQWGMAIGVGLVIAGCGGSSGGGGKGGNAGGTGGAAGTGGRGGSSGTGGSTAGTGGNSGTGGGTAGTGGSSGTGGSTAGTGGSAGAGGSAGTGGTSGSGGGGGLTALQARGQYIVDHVAACGDCHTPMGQNGPVPGMYLAGNPSFIALPNGDKLGSRNLTNDETGLKNRTDAEIKDMFQNGMRPTATGMEPLNPVMPYYVFHNMTDADANAIVAYLGPCRP